MKRLAFKSFARRVMYVFAAGSLTVGCADGAGTHALLPADLLARAENGETVRVILEIQAGAEDIHAAQELVFEQLSGTGYRVTRPYRAVPFLALEVSAEALRRLMRSPVVGRIQEDLAVPHQEKMP